MKTIIAICVLVLWGGVANAADVHVNYQEGDPNVVQAESILEGHADEVWKTLIRLEDYQDFMPHVIAAHFISEEGVEALKFKNSGTFNANRLKRIAKKYQVQAPRQPGQKWDGLVFMVLNTPFPVANRWYVLQMVHDESRAQQNEYQRCWNLVLGNIDAAEGCWTLQASGDGHQTLARYHDTVNPGGKVPAWVSRVAATRSVPDMFNSLEKETARVMRLAARP